MAYDALAGEAPGEGLCRHCRACGGGTRRAAGALCGHTGVACNAQLPNSMLHCMRHDPRCSRPFEARVRGHGAFGPRVRPHLKVARTIADLDGGGTICAGHISGLCSTAGWTGNTGMTREAPRCRNRPRGRHIACRGPAFPIRGQPARQHPCRKSPVFDNPPSGHQLCAQHIAHNVV